MHELNISSDMVYLPLNDNLGFLAPFFEDFLLVYLQRHKTPVCAIRYLDPPCCTPPYPSTRAFIISRIHTYLR